MAILPGADFYFMATHLGARAASVDFDGAMVYEAWPGRPNDKDRIAESLFPNLKYGCDMLEDFLNKL